MFFLWVLLLLGFDLVTFRCFPVPWYDEALFADPAATLVLQGHWTSTIWFGRGDFSYWGGNMPAYSLLLVPWLWLWGMGELAVRSFNYVLFALTLVCLWFSVKRLNLIPSAKFRLATLCALSLCYPVSYCVRCGRPDVLGMLLFALSAFFWTSPRKIIAHVGLFICAFIIPFVGLQYAFYMPVLLGVLLWAGGKPALNRLCAIIGGGIIGGILLVAYYHFVAGWDGLLANMSNVHARLPSGVWDRIRMLIKTQILFYYFGRPHFILLIAASGLLAITWKRLTGISRRTLLLGMTMLLVPGVALGLFSHFMAPYHWLAVAPALILLASAAAKSWGKISPGVKMLCVLLALGLAVSGRLVFVMLGWGVADAAYTDQMQKAAAAQVRPGEVVFIDPQVYYAIKPVASRIYVSQIVPVLNAQEKDSVTVAFLHVNGIDFSPTWFTNNNFSGHWVRVTDLPAPCSQVKISPFVSKLLGWFHAAAYIGEPLAVYRREDAGQ
ncbi:MAG TPA: hypothetical protein VG347_18960 [Verrucomicrobiae bacterium]|nr:hypothetical protein [Verrucomicrobiae bacterium]